MKYYIKQESTNDCANACIKMILSYYHKNENFLNLKFKENHSNFNEIKKVLHEYNLEAKGVNVSDNTYLDSFKYVIAQIKKNNLNHFVVFKKKEGKYIYLLDPSVGERILTLEEYLKISTGNYLLIDKVDEYKLESIIKIENKYKITYFSIYSISFLLDFFFIYMFTYMTTRVLPLILLVTALIFNFLLKLLIILSFDKYLEAKLLYKIFDKENNIENFSNRMKLKSTYIEYYFKSISYFFISLFLVVLLISDHIYNLILIVVAFIFLTFKYSLVQRRKIRIQELTIKEEDSLVTLSKTKYLKLKKISFKLMTLLISFYALFFIFNVFLGLFINFLESSRSFTHLVFLILTNVSLFEFIVKIVEINAKFKESEHSLISKINS